MRLPDPPLLVVTDRSQATMPLADILKAAFSGGCRWASLREKDLTEHDQIRLARELLPIARQYGARLTLHGDPQIAKKAGLDGVHLPGGKSPATARALLGADAWIGLSIHSAEEVAALDASELNYVIAGPAFESVSKPGHGPALGADGLKRIVQSSAFPVIAIGGIEPAVIQAIAASGIGGIATMGNVMRSATPQSEVKSLISAWRTHFANKT